MNSMRKHAFALCSFLAVRFRSVDGSFAHGSVDVADLGRVPPSQVRLALRVSLALICFVLVVPLGVWNSSGLRQIAHSIVYAC